MKTRRILIAVAALLMASTIDAGAQGFWDRLGRAAGRAAERAAERAVTDQVERRTEQAIDGAIDGAVDGVLEGKDKQDDSNNTPAKADTQSTQQATDTDAAKTAEELLNVKNVSESWESNDFTRQVPKPDIDVEAAMESALGYTASFKDATLEQVKRYAERVKSSGFNGGVTESTGMYIFYGQNSAGWSVIISWSDGESGVVISKPM